MGGAPQAAPVLPAQFLMLDEILNQAGPFIGHTIKPIYVARHLISDDTWKVWNNNVIYPFPTNASWSLPEGMLVFAAEEGIYKFFYYNNNKLGLVREVNSEGEETFHYD